MWPEALLGGPEAGGNAQIAAAAATVNNSVLVLPSGDTTGATDAAAITAADAAVVALGGGAVVLPDIVTISATQTQSNRVRWQGAATRVSGVKAAATFTGTYLVNCVNGISSMFDAGFRDLTIDANNVAGLGCVLSDALQENSTIERVLIKNFDTYGIRCQNGYGGASSLLIDSAEVFGGTLAGDAGIYIDNGSAAGAFKVTIRNSTVAGGTGGLTTGIYCKESLSLQNVHFEVVTNGVYIDGAGHHVLINVDGASSDTGVTNLVRIASTFTGSLTMIGCQRNGATNFLLDERSGGLGTITTDVPFLHIGAPEFSASVSADINDVTGNGTAYSIVFNSETVDTHAAFNTSTGIFTAPLPGLYMFDVMVKMNLPAGSTNVIFELTAAGGSYYLFRGTANPLRDSSGNIYWRGSALVRMAQSQTARVYVTVYGIGANTADVLAGATFAGRYLNA